MVTVLLVTYIVVAFSMIVLILLQRSEGGALGMGGGGGFVTGRGAANLLTRITAILAAIFFTGALALGVLSHKPAPVSAVGGGSPAQSGTDSAPAGEKAPESLPALKLPKLKVPSPGAQGSTGSAPAQPQLPQTQ
jgi:preprotein translocase subunit SecG